LASSERIYKDPREWVCLRGVQRHIAQSSRQLRVLELAFYPLWFLCGRWWCLLGPFVGPQ
jgi:hypothetical protein